MPAFTPLVSVPDDPHDHSPDDNHGSGDRHDDRSPSDRDDRIPESGPLGRWYVIRQSEVLVDGAGELPGLSKGPESFGLDAVVEEPVLMGRYGDDLCWAVGVDAEAQAPDGYRWAPLMMLGGAWVTDEWALAGRAVQLVEWRRTSRYCGRCGWQTEASPGERAMRCPNCGLLAYPRLAPAIIVLVRRGPRALLAAGPNFRNGMHSALAGFVEPGEDLEQAVHREVMEEVGIKLRDVRYVASQPWPFPHSLMVAFTAEWAEQEIEMDGQEIVSADWYTVDDLPPTPPPMSIAHRLIEDWIRDVTEGPAA